MGNLVGFKAEDQEEMRGSYDLLPVGKYTAIIVESDLVENSKKNGKILKLTFQTVGGDYPDRLVWANLNLENPNELAEKIGRSELAAICKSLGILHPKDSAELHDTPLLISVKIEPSKGEYEAKNKIAGYESCVKSTVSTTPSEEKKVPSWRR